jgi:hypothetical protein
MISLLAIGCSDDKMTPEAGPDDVKIEPIVDSDLFTVKELSTDIEMVEVIAFNNNYIFGGFDGFVITDQSLNEVAEYEQDMIVDQLINYHDEFACICTTEGIFKIDQNLTISKILDLPCTDMEVDGNGRILFVSGVGELSKERQISANILTLNVDEQQYEFYSDPTDSIDTFLGQLEILSNGDVFALGTDAGVYQYQGKNVIAKYSKLNVDFFPDDPSGLGTGYKILAVDNELYYIARQFPKRLLKFEENWKAVFDLDIGSYANYDAIPPKDRAIINGTFNNLDKLHNQVVISAQEGIIKVDPLSNEYDFIKDPNFPSDYVRKVYTTPTEEVIIILSDNTIVKYEN